MNKDWLGLIPENSILTPHPKEFDRIAGEHRTGFERNQKQIELAQQLGVYIVLKGAHTAIACPDGRCFFNSTGNPGMATAGSGDVLTGILLSLLAQGYSPEDAALTGVFIHGLAADMAIKKIGEYSLISTDIIDYLGKAFLRLLKIKNKN
jgi:NAD(P)H-hydrate epimerase